MKRRRGRAGLGSSAAVHAKRGVRAAESANEAAHNVIRFAEDGACAMAYANLTGMNFHHGQAQAHGKLPNGGLTVRASHVFRRNCMRE